MSTPSKFYSCLGLPNFFHILKFLGQEEQIILMCARLPLPAHFMGPCPRDILLSLPSSLSQKWRRKQSVLYQLRGRWRRWCEEWPFYPQTQKRYKREGRDGERGREGERGANAKKDVCHLRLWRRRRLWRERGRRKHKFMGPPPGRSVGPLGSSRAPRLNQKDSE